MAKKTTAPTEDDWRRVIADFKRNRDFDRTEFREEAEQLASALKRQAASADDTAMRIEREQVVKPSAHDGSTIVGRLKDDGHRKQLLDLAGLDLLILDPIEPWLKEADPHGRLGLDALIADHRRDIIRRMEAASLNAPLVAETAQQRSRRDQMEEIFERWGLNSSAEPIRHRPSVLLRRQADLLNGGADHLRSLVDDHVRRANAIKPAVSVALHELFEATAPWKIETVEIARQLVKAEVRPGRGDALSDVVPRPMSERERKAAIKQWHTSLRQARLDWSNRKTPNPRKPTKE